MTPDSAPSAGRIVVGIDGSPPSLAALEWAANQAALTGGTLDVVMTWEWPSSLGWAMPVPDEFDPEGDMRTLLDTAIASVRAAHPGVAVEGRLIGGHPSPVLVEASKDAALLVVGSRGHGEFVGMVLGSVSGFCVAHAHSPVLVHRTPS
ncbi:MAG TPA: universal stress protein [Acidimicrobiales bacterium]|nr:universal stress protein [Acidimicrobiales bacterium]